MPFLFGYKLIVYAVISCTSHEMAKNMMVTYRQPRFLNSLIWDRNMVGKNTVSSIVLLTVQ